MRNVVSIMSAAAQDLHNNNDICVEFLALAFVTLQLDGSLQLGS